MTTIAALVLDGTVHMAADSCNNVYDRPIIGGAQKIIRHPAGDGEVLLAVTGSGGIMRIIPQRLHVEAAPSGGEDPQSWADAVAFALTELCVEARMLNTDGVMDGTVLLGWNARLWSLTHMQAIPHPDGVGALGTGEGPAIGVIDALRARDGNGRDIVTEAVRVACHRDRYSAEPVQYEAL